jgi:hypothetical protein
MNDVKNLRNTVIPKSDQLNSEQLISAPMTILVSDVTRTQSADQPVSIHYAADTTRPFKPCKTMRKVLIAAWGDDGSLWIGRSMTLFNDPEVKWAGEKVGGIRISHMSDIPSDKIKLSLTETRGKKKTYEILRLVVDTIDSHKKRLSEAAQCGTVAFNAAWDITPVKMMHQLGKQYKADMLVEAANHDAGGEFE